MLNKCMKCKITAGQGITNSTTKSSTENKGESGKRSKCAAMMGGVEENPKNLVFATVFG